MKRKNNFSQAVGYIMATLDTAADSWQKTGMIYFDISPKQLEELIKLRDAINQVMDLPGNVLINDINTLK